MRFSNVLSIPRDTTHRPASAKSSCCLFNLFSLQMKRQPHKPPTLTLPLHPMEIATQLPTLPLCCLPAISLGCCQAPLLYPRVTRESAQELGRRMSYPIPSNQSVPGERPDPWVLSPRGFPTSSPGTLITNRPHGTFTAPGPSLPSPCHVSTDRAVPASRKPSWFPEPMENSLLGVSAVMNSGPTLNGTQQHYEALRACYI